MPVPQTAQQLREERREALGTDTVGHQPAELQQFYFGRTVARQSVTRALDELLVWRRVFEQRNRVLPRVARQLAYLVEDLALLGLAHMRIAWRQRPYQIVPTGSLHLTDLTFGRILI
jgi:hypothetical protein